MSIPTKSKLVRLHGAALKKLNDVIFERDNHSCVICGAWVEDGVKFHHEPCGAGSKSDEISKGVVLCNICHYKRHFIDVQEYRTKVEKYLEEIYCDIYHYA